MCYMRILMILLMGTALLGGVARAEKPNVLLSGEKPDMSPQDLQETATHIVVGMVTGVYQGEFFLGRDWRNTRYVAEIRVGKCEKGTGLKTGDVVYVRYFQRVWKGKGVPPPPGNGGHRGTPSGGFVVRVYLARNAYDGFTGQHSDGGFNVLGPNGFEVLQKGPR
jgi:hypothetical protein